MGKSDIVQQVVLPADMTSSKSGTFCFAFGSNLSPHQVSLRLNANPKSSQPVAIARLDGYTWIICERGYANVVSLPPNNQPSHNNVVWGVVYNLSAEDEARLDMYEGHDERRNPKPRVNPDPSKQQEVPFLQGEWDYNKHYLPITVSRWLRDPAEYGIKVETWKDEQTQPVSIRALVYVDELRTKPGKINEEYIGRMNRAIRHSVELGLPKDWVDAVMRRYIPPGVEVDHEGYIGTDQGYIEAEATETASNLKERVLREAK